MPAAREPARVDSWRCPILVEFLIILGLVLANGLFSGTEIAVVSMRKSRLRELVDAGNRSARAVQTLRDDPERFFATVQIVITVVGATAGAYGGATFAEHLHPLLAGVPLLAPYAQAISVALVVVLLSYLSLVLGELVPKSLALRAAEGFSLAVGRPLLALSWVARPLVWLLTVSSNVVLRVFGDKTSFAESRLSSDELQLLVDEASKTGSVDPRAGAIASRAIDFGDLTLRDVMVPRPQVVAISREAAAAEVKRILLEVGHSRMPVYERTIDNVVGYVALKDLLGMALDKGQVELDKAIRPAWFVPETMRAVELLRQMQDRRSQLAIVVDEQGGVSGIVTLEDLMEELVGEIVSEHGSAPPEPIHRDADGSALVQGNVPLRDVNRALEMELPESEAYTTIAGLCNALQGHIPVKGDRMSTESGITLEVVEASARRVRLVRITPRRPEATE